MANKRRRKANQNRGRQQPARAAATETEERPASSRPQRQHQQERPEQRPQQQGAPRVRAEKKEIARRQREEIRKRIARKRRARQLLTLSVVSVAIAAGVLFITRPKEHVPSSALPGLLTTEAPWDANGAQSAARAGVLGLPAEGTIMHTHANLQIFVHGKAETVPVNIGITDTAIQSLHTHDTSGTVHMESSVARTFTLGDFFDVWGVRFTPSCLGAYCNDGNGNTLQVFVNGQEQTSDPTQIVMNDLDVIVVAYGNPTEPGPVHVRLHDRHAVDGGELVEAPSPERRRTDRELEGSTVQAAAARRRTAPPGDHPGDHARRRGGPPLFPVRADHRTRRGERRRALGGAFGRMRRRHPPAGFRARRAPPPTRRELHVRPAPRDLRPA
jgi:hypothetical protein